MFSTKNSIFEIFAVVGLLAIGTAPRTAIAAAQVASAAPQAANSDAPAITPASPRVAAGEVEAKKLLILMDADKSGKVSRAEFMNFMAAEFDRLDTNHDGELDVKELEQSQLATAHRGGTHR